MSDISIRHEHSLPHQKAVTEAKQILDELSREYGVAIQDMDDSCYGFSGSGVTGTVRVMPDCIEVQAQLGFLAMALKPMLENKIQEKLDAHFSSRR